MATEYGRRVRTGCALALIAIGMDVLLQRLGRLHRHPRSDRPAGYAEARCVVLTFAERDLAPLLKGGRHGLRPGRDFRGVYPDVRVIEATSRLPEAHPQFRVPDANRMLVEGAMHPEVLEALSDELGPAWRWHVDEIWGQGSADWSVAALHTIQRDQPFQDLRFPGFGERVQTRLGADSRRSTSARAVATCQSGPSGAPSTCSRCRSTCVAAYPAMLPITVTKQRPDGFQFTVGDQPFAYGRQRGQELDGWGLRKRAFAVLPRSVP